MYYLNSQEKTLIKMQKNIFAHAFSQTILTRQIIITLFNSIQKNSIQKCFISQFLSHTTFIMYDEKWSYLEWS